MVCIRTSLVSNWRWTRECKTRDHLLFTRLLDTCRRLRLHRIVEGLYVFWGVQTGWAVVLSSDDFGWSAWSSGGSEWHGTPIVRTSYVPYILHAKEQRQTSEASDMQGASGRQPFREHVKNQVDPERKKIEQMRKKSRTHTHTKQESQGQIKINRSPQADFCTKPLWTQAQFVNLQLL